MPTPGVDFFRVDRSGSVRRLLVTAGLFVLVGMTLVGAHLVSRLSESLAHLVALGGGLMVAVGLILGFGALAMILLENVYLLLEAECIVCHDNGKETKIPWGEVGSVTVDAKSGFVVVERKGAEALRWFAGKSAKDVSQRIDEARRKAIHGLLKTDS